MGNGRFPKTTLQKKSTDHLNGCCPICISLPDTELYGVTSSLAFFLLSGSSLAALGSLSPNKVLVLNPFLRLCFLEKQA